MKKLGILVTFAILLILVTGCQSAVTGTPSLATEPALLPTTSPIPPTATETLDPTVTSVPPTSTAIDITPTSEKAEPKEEQRATAKPTTSQDGPTGMSAEESTLGSLEQVDDYPLYTMHYYGDYNQRASSIKRDAWLANADLLPAWACSLFAALGDEDNLLYGRNFDWEFSPALLLFTHPSDGYASVSMVDIAYLGFAGSKAHTLLDLPLAERQGLLDAPFLPFDGMNDQGLVVGMAAVPPGNVQPDPDKETIGSLGVIREMLDHASNVDEAIAIVQSYNVDMGGGPPIHYLIADRSGHSVLIEFYEGEMVIIPNDAPWHQATNFLRASVGDSTEGQCWRHDKLSQDLTQAEGRLSEQEAMALLAQVSQPSTQWSVVYRMSTGDIDVTMGRKYDEPHTLHLDLKEDTRSLAAQAETLSSGFEKISLITEDSVTLSGRLFGDGEIAVILTHMGASNATQDSWFDFATTIAGMGFTALTLDFRGIGQSEGNLVQSHLIYDVRAAIEFLQSKGYDRIVCMGASMGGTTCLKAAVETELEGLVVIASPMSIGAPTSVPPKDFALLTMPKLFVCAEDDGYNLARSAKVMYNTAPEPKDLKIFPGTAHGTDLFYTPSGNEFRKLLIDFLEALR